MKCRSVEQCSLSRIIKRLDTRIDSLFHETKPALIRKLRELAIEPSIYEPSRALNAMNVAPEGWRSTACRRMWIARCPRARCQTGKRGIRRTGARWVQFGRASEPRASATRVRRMRPRSRPRRRVPRPARHDAIVQRGRAPENRRHRANLSAPGWRLHGVTLNRRPRRMSRPRGPRSSPLADADILRDDRPFALDVGRGRCSRCHGRPRRYAASL